MITRKYRAAVSLMSILAFPLDAHARGENGLVLLILIGFFAPLFAYFIEIWLLLGLTLMPLGIGLWMLVTAKSDAGVLPALLLIALGGVFTYVVAGKDIKRILDRKRGDNG